MFTDLEPYSINRDIGLPWLRSVPEGWLVERAKTLLRRVDVRSTDGDEELLTVSSARGIVPRSSATVSMFQATSYAGHKLCWPGDLVINSLWAWGRGLGVSTHHGIVSTAYGVYRPRNIDRVNPDFLHELVRSAPFQWELQVRSRGVWKSRLQLTDDQFFCAPLPLPPMVEQAAIVKYLSHAHARIDRAIVAKRKLIALLVEQKQVVINQAVTHGLDPTVPLKDSGISWLGEIPDHWQLWPIGRLTRVGNGSTPSRTTPEFWQGGNYPWLNSSFANKWEVLEADQFVTTRALAECHLPIVPPGSVIVAITGQGKTRGKAALLKMEATINQHLAYLTPDPRRLTGPFLQAALVAAYPELRRISDDSGSTKGALTCHDLKVFRVPVPPLVEQAQIVQWIRERTETAEAAAGRAAREIELLREFRTRLTADVVTGQVDIRAAAGRLPELDLSDLVSDVGESDEDHLDAELAESLEAVDA